MDFLRFWWPFVAYKFCELKKKLSNELIETQTNCGPVKGLKQTSDYGYEYIEFSGIPYGKPPVGSFRFKDPEPVEPWTKPLIALTNTRSYHQHLLLPIIIGTEDCLHLNVYTKNLSPKLPFPVMVFIHGGGFTYGSKEKDFQNPEYLLMKDIILVVINYRLGAFGFLSIDDPAIGIPGNAGLKDQVLALKWIKKNIAYFGGDPNNITLFGESAGACSVHMHMMSHMSKGLFHKAGTMSGTALSAWSINPIKELPQRLAKQLGWNGVGGCKKMVEVLQSVSPKKIIMAQSAVINKDELLRFMLFPFGPVIEPYQSKQCFIPKSPFSMDKECWSTDIPLLIGGCANEGLMIHKLVKNNPKILEKLNKNCEFIIPLGVEPNVQNEHFKAMGIKIKQHYFGNKEMSISCIDTYIQLMGDMFFWFGIYVAIIRRLNERINANNYFYRFNFDSFDQNLAKIYFAGHGISGVCHGDDLSYLFKNATTYFQSKNTREFQTAMKMIELWTSFAINGQPISDTGNCYNWTPLKRNKTLQCLNISDNLELIEFPELSRMIFFSSIFTDFIQ